MTDQQLLHLMRNLDGIVQERKVQIHVELFAPERDGSQKYSVAVWDFTDDPNGMLMIDEVI